MPMIRVRPMHLKSPFRWDPWQEMENLRLALDRIGGRSTVGVPPGTGGEALAPEVDLYDAGVAFEIRVDLPGVREEELEITVGGSVVTIRGQRDPDGPRDESYLCCERPVGTFERAIELPVPVDAEQARATLSHGVLEVTVPKSPPAGVKKVPISAGEPRRIRLLIAATEGTVKTIHPS